MQITLIDSTKDIINRIAMIAGICYDSNSKNPMALVKKLYQNGHHSVFEHITFTFKISGISRALLAQITRHRIGTAFTVRSQRYCNEDGFNYVMPDSICMNDEILASYNTFMQSVEDYYKELQVKNIPNEDARMVLPNACYTQMYFTLNLREFIHIANERLCYHAQAEIREMIGEMVKLVDSEIQWMLVPKCKSGFMKCNSPCNHTL